MYEIREVAKNVWKLTEEGWVSSYLVVGSERALLIDAGLGTGPIWEEVEKLTTLPCDLVLTHDHGDHLGGAGHYDMVFCHVNELMEIWKAIGKVPYAVAEGYRFELGDRVLLVTELFGHTKGSIGLWDQQNRILFTGDVLSDTPVWMTGADADLFAYIETMDKLAGMGDRVDKFFGAHELTPMDLSWAEKLKTCAQEILKGNYRLEKYTSDEGRLMDRAVVGDASMLVDLSRDYTQK